MVRTCSLAAAVVLASGASAWAQEEPPPIPPPEPSAGAAEGVRPQRVETGYRLNLSNPKIIDRWNVADLSIGAMDALHVGLGDSGDDVPALRAVKWGLSTWFAVSVSYMAHEYGHLSVVSKTGHRDAVFGTPGQPRSEWSSLSAGELFVQGLDIRKDSVVTLREEEWQEVIAELGNDPDAIARLNLMLEAGGFNQEQAIVTRYGARARDGAFSYLDSTGYLWTALGTIRYPASVDESDLGDYSELLEARGYHASPARIKALSALRLVGGGGAVALSALFVGLFSDEGGTIEGFWIEPADGWRLYWPEFESYLTQAGPTVRASVPIRLEAVELLPALERSFAGGDEVVEGSLRIRAPVFAFLRVEAALHRSDRGGTWHALSAEILPFPWLALTVGIEGGRGYTFERDVYGSGNEFVEDSERALLLGLRLAAAF